MTSNDATPWPIALVTGASSGIGEAFAHLLAQEGHHLVLVAHNSEDLDRVAAKIAGEHKMQSHTFGMDLSRPGAVNRLLEDLYQQDLRPDLLVNNAGFGLMGEAVELNADEQVDMINLNVTALTELSLRCGKAMARRGRGGIINISSVAGTLPGPNMAVYYATKAYILSFTEALAAELRPSGVQVTVVAPGVTRTAFHQRAGMERSRLLKWSAAMLPETVARLGYQGFCRGRTVVATGVFNKLSMVCTRLIPNAILSPMISRLHTSVQSPEQFAQASTMREKTDQ
ncbi:MAG: SDR family oxidoreductase [Alphaproteobacteria bacterium]|nr:SDR family oxidoreductase [Alphaproteobacteria bacterium]